jgi:hypothetical protein
MGGRSLAKADPAKLHDMHMIMPSVGRSEHLDLFERGIVRKLDFVLSADNVVGLRPALTYQFC